MSKERLSRREFLYMGAVASAGVALAACQPKTVVVKETVQVTSEVTKVVEQTKIVEQTKVVEKQVTPTPLPSKFGEAPLLADQVKAGKLPAAEERVPQDPLVLTPAEVGTYGGIARTASDSAGQYGLDAQMFTADKMCFLTREGDDCLKLLPAMASSWEMSADAKTITIHVRRGVKWSDGQPFTADDLMFNWDDVVRNDELSPTKPYWWYVDGVLMDVVKQDDYTVVMNCPAPTPMAIAYFARGWFDIYFPKHYVQQYHVRYADKAALETAAKDAGFEFWYQNFWAKASYWGMEDAPYHPTLFALLYKAKGVDYVEGERNPYFWMVDSKGNQLPYYDGVFATAVANREVGTAKLLAGEVDFFGWLSQTENYPLYQENAEKGKYKVLLWKSVWAAEAGFGANQTYTKDLVLRDIFRDVRFRRALSLGMDRDEINTTLYFGKATPRQLTVLPSSRYFVPEYEKAYAQKDVAEANRLLDEMGLDKKNADGLRLRPDGQVLTWQIDYPEAGERPREIVAQLVIEQWRQNIGIHPTLKGYTGSLMGTRVQANDIQMNIGDCDNAMDIMFVGTPYWSVPMNYGWEWSWETLWGQWYQTNGKQGEEPPQLLKDILNTWLKMRATLDEDERTRLGKEILKAQAENLWCIGTVGMAPFPICVASNLTNIPDEQLWGWDCFFGVILGAPAWFFKQPLLDRQKPSA